jgi:tRNA-binding protein
VENQESEHPSGAVPISYQDFEKVQIHVGTVLEARPNPKARKPALVLTIDFGPLGVKTSSAQITRNYAPEELTGTQVAAVLNFPPLRIAGIKSEVLVLGAMSEEKEVVLLRPTESVADGTRVA